MDKLNVKAFAVACGTLWGLAVFGLGIFDMFGWGTKFLEVLSSLYIGYAPTLVGVFIGAIWAFADGFVGGAVLAWVYNVSCRTCCAERTVRRTRRKK